MKFSIKTLTTIILVLLFVTAFLFGIAILFFISWFRTFNTFTSQTPIGTVSISDIGTDELGQYFTLTLNLYENQSTTSSLFFGTSETSSTETANTESYKLYGDEFTIGGVFVRMEDLALLSNIENVYQISRIQAEYTDAQVEDRRDSDTMKSRVDINSDMEQWRDVRQTYRSGGPIGQIYNFFIDSINITAQGDFVEEDITYTVFVTPNGFVLKEDGE